MGVNKMKILIVENDRDIALVYRVALEDRTHHLTVTDNGEDCLKVYGQKLRNFICGNISIDLKQHPFDAYNAFCSITFVVIEE
jgi:CheY-like chemotaxis protein